jgi:hypothetical protein
MKLPPTVAKLHQSPEEFKEIISVVPYLLFLWSIQLSLQALLVRFRNYGYVHVRETARTRKPLCGIAC